MSQDTPVGTTSATEIVSDIEILTFQAPGTSTAQLDDEAVQVNVASIVSVVGVNFTFQENANTPGRVLQQTRSVTRPAGSGFFTGLNFFKSSFTTSNFQFLTERPLGEISVSLGLLADNQTLVCQVRLTDSNQDDPIDIRVRGFIAFYN